MTVKIVTLKNKEFSYTGTTVPFSRSKDQIKEMLIKRGCEQIYEAMDVKDPEKPYYAIAFEHRGIKYRLDFPVTYVKMASGSRLNMNVSGWIMHDRIKALLISVDIDYLSFSQAMMPFLLMPGEEGLTTLENAIESNQLALESQRFDLRHCLLLPGE